ncbi:hypothetical protein SSX86_030302 [Deinandra increscens subsp. villosa]|uniref:Small ribosomal subunit protein uS15 N-terminal domain-containing protein n=1 Tax=Deinandra increscens subsp. villosa TaxID=3103831 RepID=A0AAP0GJT5_9ASTR
MWPNIAAAAATAVSLVVVTEFEPLWLTLCPAADRGVYKFVELCFEGQVQDSICKLAKKGLTPSQIGVILRDSHGIAQVNSVTGSKILQILKAHGSYSSKRCCSHQMLKQGLE